jgi:hypothetical protein
LDEKGKNPFASGFRDEAMNKPPNVEKKDRKEVHIYTLIH